MPIVIKLPVEVKEIRPITVCFIAEVPYMVPTEVKIPNEVLKKLRESGLPDGYPVSICVAPLKYVEEKEGCVRLEDPEVFGLPVAAIVYFRYDRGIRLSELFWDLFAAGYRKYLEGLKKGDPVKVRIVIHAALFVIEREKSNVEKS